jgi:ABC-2 type transport system permease protein
MAMLAVIAGAPVFLGVVLRINTPAPGSGGPGAGVFIGQIAGNGVFLSLFAIYVLLTVLLPLAVSVVAGDSVAGEAGLGTLRTLLTVPAGRIRLLLVKYVTIVTFCLTATVLVAGVGLLMGVIFFPVGPVTLLSGTTVSLAAGLARLALIALYVAAALSALGAIGLALSTFTQHAIAVMATVLVLVIVSEILDAVSQVAAIHPYLPTHFWFSFDALLRTPIAWSQVGHGVVSFAAYTVIFGAVAWTRMRRANITC